MAKLGFSNSRVFILALDGLEYELVVRWNLRQLMQETFGKYPIPKHYMHETEEGLTPYTPIIWVSFLTGRHPKEHNVKSMWKYNGVWDKIRRLPIISWVKGKRRIFKKFGIKPQLINRSHYDFPTIFDIFQPSKAVNFIGYNAVTEIWEHMNLMFKKKLEMKKVEQFGWEAYHKICELMFREMNGEWRLFAVYFPILDLFSHFYMNKSVKKLLIAYQTFDHLVYKIKERIGDDCLFLILSDHGHEIDNHRLTGNHSHQAFWSVNVETEWKPKEITDFFYKISEWLGGERNGA